MMNWIGGSTTAPTTVRLWFTNQAKGVIQIFEAGNPAVLLAEGRDDVTYVLPARATPINLVISTAGSRPPPGEIRLMMAVTQNGTMLTAFEGTRPANDPPPDGPATFTAPVPNGGLGTFDARVRFP